MLKTLKLTSLIAVVVAAGVVFVLIAFGLKGNPEVAALLDSPGIADSFRDNVEKEIKKEDVSSPLVEQARAFALRIDPPPPPPKPKPDRPKPPPTTARKVPTKPTPPKPKVTVAPKSDLLATVMYASAPEKSLALFKAGTKQEWFRQGETIGNLQIVEIRDGSVILTQGGKNLPEQFVPAKPKVKSILKSGTSASPVTQPRPGGVTGPATAAPGTRATVPVDSQPTSLQPGAPVRPTPGATRPVRSSDPTSRPRTNATDRIRRVRSVPRQATPAEQKASLENTLSGIEDIMNREDESIPAEERQKEKELWMSLIETLKTEKENLDAKTDAQGAEEKADAQPQEEKKEKALTDKEKSSSRDPNNKK